jgi:hypothetical protein
MRARTVPLSVAVALAGILVGGRTATAMPGLYQYSFQYSETRTDTTTGVGDDTGVCDPVESVDLQARISFHVQATEPGLTQEGIEALLDDDPDGVLVRVTYTENGTFVAHEGGHTYTGHYTQWFGGGAADGHFGFTFTFTVAGTSELGTPLHAHFVSHFVGTDDLTKVVFDRGGATGCLPAA